MTVALEPCFALERWGTSWTGTEGRSIFGRKFCSVSPNFSYFSVAFLFFFPETRLYISAGLLRQFVSLGSSATVVVRCSLCGGVSALARGFVKSLLGPSIGLLLRHVAVASSVVDFLGRHSLSMRFGWCVVACCLLYTSPSPRDATLSRMPSSA